MNWPLKRVSEVGISRVSPLSELRIHICLVHHVKLSFLLLMESPCIGLQAIDNTKHYPSTVSNRCF